MPDVPVTTGGDEHGAVSVPPVRRRVGVVIVTQGTRPTQLAAAVASVQQQTGVDLDCVVVGNGWAPADLPVEIRTIALPENIGIPAGRNVGIRDVHGDVVFLLDDDAALPEPDTLQRLARMFAEDDSLGIVQLRILDPVGNVTPRRYVPRLRAGDPTHSSDVTTFCEGATAIRRAVFDTAGFFEDRFWYAHEGTDLAWRTLDAGYRVYYFGALVAHHPATVPARRHGEFYFLSARNRVWLARRHLPAIFAVIYPTVWLLITLARLRDTGGVAQTVRGYLAGLRQDCGPRRPLRWSTVWRMTRIGRPPFV